VVLSKPSPIRAFLLPHIENSRQSRNGVRSHIYKYTYIDRHSFLNKYISNTNSIYILSSIKRVAFDWERWRRTIGLTQPH
jgi:hypothetical protein